MAAQGQIAEKFRSAETQELLKGRVDAQFSVAPFTINHSFDSYFAQLQVYHHNERHI